MTERVARVRWAAHGHEMSSFVSRIRNKDMYSDCLLACSGGHVIPAHRLVLAMASPFFTSIFKSFPATNTNPIIVLDGVAVEQMEALLQYMYYGYSIIRCEDLPALCRIAKSLGIKEFPSLEIAPSRPKCSNQTMEEKRVLSYLSKHGKQKFLDDDPLNDILWPKHKKLKSSLDKPQQHTESTSNNIIRDALNSAQSSPRHGISSEDSPTFPSYKQLPVKFGPADVTPPPPPPPPPTPPLKQVTPILHTGAKDADVAARPSKDTRASNGSGEIRVDHPLINPKEIKLEEMEECIEISEDDEQSEPQHTSVPLRLRHTSADLLNTSRDLRTTSSNIRNKSTDLRNMSTHFRTTSPDSRNTPPDPRNTPPDPRNTTPDRPNRSPNIRTTPPDPRNRSPDLRNTSADPRNTPPDRPNRSPDRNAPSDPHNRSSDPRNKSPDPRNKSPDPHNKSLDPRNRSPGPRNRSSDPCNMSPDPRSRSPDPHNRSLDPRNRSPDPRNRSSDPRNMSPDPRSRSPDPHNRSPDPRNRSPDPRSRSSNPRNKSPDPRNRSLDPRSRSPDPRNRSPEIRKRSPDPRNRSPDPRKRSPDPRNRSPDPRNRSPDPRNRTPDPRNRSPDPRTTPTELRIATPVPRKTLTELRITSLGSHSAPAEIRDSSVELLLTSSDLRMKSAAARTASTEHWEESVEARSGPRVQWKESDKTAQSTLSAESRRSADERSASNGETDNSQEPSGAKSNGFNTVGSTSPTRKISQLESFLLSSRNKDFPASSSIQIILNTAGSRSVSPNPVQTPLTPPYKRPQSVPSKSILSPSDAPSEHSNKQTFPSLRQNLVNKTPPPRLTSLDHQHEIDKRRLLEQSNRAKTLSPVQGSSGTELQRNVNGNSSANASKSPSTESTSCVVIDKDVRMESLERQQWRPPPVTRIATYEGIPTIQTKKCGPKTGPPPLLSMVNGIDYMKMAESSGECLRMNGTHRNSFMVLNSATHSAHPTLTELTTRHHPALSQLHLHHSHTQFPKTVPYRPLPLPVDPRIKRVYESTSPNIPHERMAEVDPRIKMVHEPTGPPDPLNEKIIEPHTPHSDDSLRQHSLPINLSRNGMTNCYSSIKTDVHKLKLTKLETYTPTAETANIDSQSTTIAQLPADTSASASWESQHRQHHHHQQQNKQQHNINKPQHASDEQDWQVTRNTDTVTVNDDPLLTRITTTKRKRLRGPKSWEFLLRLLKDSSTNPALIRWENEKECIFRLVKPDAIALRWGKRNEKHSSDMLSYENFARGLRYHYNTGALSAVSERCFVYKFGPKAQKALNGEEDGAATMSNFTEECKDE